MDNEDHRPSLCQSRGAQTFAILTLFIVDDYHSADYVYVCSCIVLLRCKMVY
jgi:hypothetical protein